jgi:purine-binding chemotaxis protein CheW
VTKQPNAMPLLVKETKTKVNVVEGVLQNYLDQLLVTATQPAPTVEKVIEIPADVAVVEANVVEVNVVEANVVEVNVVEANVVEANVVERVSSSIADTVTATLPALTDPESWSSQGVECLIFNVCGLKLAVPLLYLGGVHEVNRDDVKSLVGQPGWYLGIVHTDEYNLQVIDTAHLIMPERRPYLAEQGFKYLIQLEKTPWAIACQSIDDTVRLNASEINWRGERGKRNWLAGTVIEKMCALVDVNGLLQHVDLSCESI